MEIELNGAPHRIEERQNVQQLIDALQLSGQALAVAVNRNIVPRQRWSAHVLHPSDRVDIVKAIGGG